MAKINQLPVGIASILGIKSSGVSPYMLLDEVRATFDATLFYFIGQERGGFNTRTPAVVGFTGGGSVLTVPASEFWLVTEFSVRATTVAAEAITFAPAFYESAPNNAGTTSTLQAVIGPQVALGASAIASTMMDRQQLVLRPGSVLGVMVNQITTAGTINVDICARYYRLP